MAITWNENAMVAGADGSRRVSQAMSIVGPDLEARLTALVGMCPGSKVADVANEIGSGLSRQINEMAREISEFGGSVTTAKDNLAGADNSLGGG